MEIRTQRRAQHRPQRRPHKSLPPERQRVDRRLNDHNRRDRRPIIFRHLQQPSQQQRSHCRKSRPHRVQNTIPTNSRKNPHTPHQPSPPSAVIVQFPRTAKEKAPILVSRDSDVTRTRVSALHKQKPRSHKRGFGYCWLLFADRSVRATRASTFRPCRRRVRRPLERPSSLPGSPPPALRSSTSAPRSSPRWSAPCAPPSSDRARPP